MKKKGCLVFYRCELYTDKKLTANLGLDLISAREKGADCEMATSWSQPHWHHVQCLNSVNSSLWMSFMIVSVESTRCIERRQKSERKRGGFWTNKYMTIFVHCRVLVWDRSFVCSHYSISTQMQCTFRMSMQYCWFSHGPLKKYPLSQVHVCHDSGTPQGFVEGKAWWTG